MILKNIFLVMFFLTSTLLIGQQTKFNFTDEICKTLNIKYDEEVTFLLYFVSDKDCLSCINKIYVPIVDNKPILTYALYYSKNDSKGFLKRLSKISNEIIWVELNNDKIIKYLYGSSANSKGPLQYIFHKGVVSINPNWMNSY